MTNKEFFASTWQNEMQTTISAIKGMPADTEKWTYKCNEKARSAADIVGHMLPHAEAIVHAADTGIGNESSKPRTFESAEAALDYFSKWASLAAEKVAALDEADWENNIVDFQVDGRSIYQMPMTRFCWMLLFDIVHHRGQLSTYYRNMGVRNPNIYGPTAEDIEAMMAAVN